NAQSLSKPELNGSGVAGDPPWAKESLKTDAAKAARPVNDEPVAAARTKLTESTPAAIAVASRMTVRRRRDRSRSCRMEASPRSRDGRSWTMADAGVFAKWTT